MQGNKPVLGLTGGIASGKSQVAGMLCQLGCLVIDSDQLNRIVLQMNEVREQIQLWWGKDTYDSQGNCNRKKIAEIVFGDPQQKKKLESLTHPRIEQLRIERMKSVANDSTIKAVVIDAPLLYEADLDRQCDAVLFVNADLELRVQRALQTRGWSGEELIRREKNQIAVDEKRVRADYCVDNNSDIESLHRQVQSVFQQFLDSQALFQST